MGKMIEAPWVGNPSEEKCTGIHCEECGDMNAKILIRDLYSNEYWFCDEGCLVDFVYSRPKTIIKHFLEVERKDA